MSANPMRYCGEYYDGETGLIYLRARYYDPSIGRFISEDPIKDGMNWYVYCGNNPVAFVDPSGCLDTPAGWGWMIKIVGFIEETQEQHYDRNENNTELVKNIKSKDDLPPDWTVSSATCHEFTAEDGSEHIKYVSPDGHFEVIFDSSGKVVTTPEDEATYNHAHPDEEPVKHAVLDVLPWILWGNSPEDSTTIVDRGGVLIEEAFN